jgi:elongation factor G
VDYRYVKQSGGRGMFAHVVLAFEPLDRGSGIVFDEKVVGGSVPRNFIPSVERGIREAAESGPLAGYPVTDMKVSLIDGSFHEVDSNEMAFKLAGAMAFREGIEKGGAVLLEPIMKVDVLVPEDYFGDVLGQISARRGEIQGTEMRSGNGQAVRAIVPLAEMAGYATELRSISQGRGVFTMEFEHYAPVSDSVAKKILN